MKTILKTAIVITIIVFLSACSSLSNLPGIASDADSTPQAQANEQGDDDEGYNDETDQFKAVCQWESMLIVMDYDHNWTWSPDGTENTGYYTGRARNEIKFLLTNVGNGKFSADTNPIFFRQDGIIDGNPGDCTVGGKGKAEITMHGYCYDGVLNLDLMEVGTEETEATMTCDGKDYNYLTYYPPQSVIGLEVSSEGLGYISSTHTFMPMFRDVYMRWNVRVVPPGQMP